jgi:hypothetical protein
MWLAESMIPFFVSKEDIGFTLCPIFLWTRNPKYVQKNQFESHARIMNCGLSQTK